MPKKKVIDDVPKDEVGECVQLHIDAGATRVTVVANSDDATCKVTVES